MNNEERYTITPDRPSGGYRIFDTVGAGRFINNQMDEAGGTEVLRAIGNFTIWKRKVEAEAWAYKLNNGLVGKVPSVLPTGSYAAAVIATPPPEEEKSAEDDGWKESSEQKARRFAHWETIVLKELEDKVVCSSCKKEYRGHNGSLAVGPNAAATHSIKITRYLGADDSSDQLTVDLECVNCGHGGMYAFKNNPIALDIPF